MFSMKKLIFQKRDKKGAICLSLLLAAMLPGICGCSASDLTDDQPVEESTVEKESEQPKEPKDPLADESASDGKIDFEALQVLNPDIFGWIYIPDIGIDQPLLQNIQEDPDYYSMHDAYSNSGGAAAYIEYPDSPEMRDFNEIIYGLDPDKVLGLRDPDTFKKAGNIYIHTAEGRSSYSIVAARKWENADIATRYAFVFGYEQERFIRDLQETMSLSDNIKDSYRDVSLGDCLITLAVPMEEDSGSQFIVVARLNTLN